MGHSFFADEIGENPANFQLQSVRGLTVPADIMSMEKEDGLGASTSDR